MKKTTKQLTLAALTLVAFQVQDTNVFAQNASLQGPIPFIMIVSDTSASMNFTDKGSRYPKRIVSGAANLANPLYVSGDAITNFPNLEEWQPSTFMDIQPAPNQNDGPIGVGACMVWEPSSCNGYRRPSWNADVDPGTITELDGEWKHEYGESDTGPMRDRFDNYMRGTDTAAVRLHWDDQPRHVMVKEVLTGDMILRPTASNLPLTSYNRNLFGPGCWFVPRHRDASGQPTPDQNICDGDSAYEELPDHTEPSAHFQEVYDGQLNNGLMDTLAATAIFSVVGFDGYKENTNWDDAFNNFMNDDVGVIPGFGPLTEGTTTCGALPCYDLGVAKIVAPSTFNVPSRYLSEISRFSQVVVRDYGYLHEGTGDDDWVLSPLSSGRPSEINSIHGETFSAGFDAYYQPHDLGKQPMAAATPIAAAMQDIRGFLRFGQGLTGPPAAQNPVNGDTFKECRPKHVVLISDGAPSPERGEVNFTFDNTDAARYPYDTAEREIMNLVDDPMIEPLGAFSPSSSVRVHVVGMNIGDADAIEKLTEMAKAGKTCAGYALGDAWKGDENGEGCDNKTTNGGSCLIKPSVTYMPYQYPTAEGNFHTCEYPALILDENDRDQLQAALSLLFNDIVQGASVATRTRAVITNEIQMETSEPAGGQSRIFSGLVTGGSQYWKGILNRQTESCKDGDYKNTALHEQIGDQVTIGTSSTSDNRRIFTSLVSERRYNYETKTPHEDLNSGVPVPGNPEMFPSSFRFQKATDEDEFRGTQLVPTNVETWAEDSRIPFEVSSLELAFPSITNFAEKLFNVEGSQGRPQEIINVFSGRIPEKVGVSNGGILQGETGRAMGGILNSNPVLVAPPSLDLPIESYRQFKARYADRHTMMYVNSMEGMLHAIHIGERKVKVREERDENLSPGNDSTGVTEDMREAWAYIPQMFHTQLDGAAGSQAYLMDGASVVQDVRLCRAREASNFSDLCDDLALGGSLEPWEQWKTVLVQGAGLAGSGYYAMDITRPGGRTLAAGGAIALQAPDPVPLWELTQAYESQQIRQIVASGQSRVASTITTDLARGSCDPSNHAEFMESSMMGISVSEPAIANILMSYDDGGPSEITEQRPVVVFGGGAEDPNSPGCAPTGRAIYVVDLQTGSIIRRFTTYFVDNATEVPFSSITNPIQLTGSPSLYDGSPGSVATRGFIGGSGGRLFRMDFVSPDPTEWSVKLFFDPNDPLTNADILAAKTAAGTLAFPFGPASFKPAIASTKDKSVIVTYGLGDASDTVTNGEAQVMIALRDRGSVLPSNLEWVEAFSPDEKLMGDPLTFDSATYWATYYLPSGDACVPGRARIWGVNFEGNGTKKAFGVWQNVDTVLNGTGILRDDTTDGVKWWGPIQPTLIRGLTLTLGVPCNVDNLGTENPSYDDEGANKPQLIAQTSGSAVEAPGFKNKNGNDQLPAGASVVDRLVVDVKQIDSKYQPLYWSAISY